MKPLLPILGLVLFRVALADSKTETDLRTRLTTSEAARVIAVRNETLLTAQVSALIAANNTLNARLIAIAKAAEIPTTAANAVAKAQVESTQTLANSEFSVKSQTEFEKQLTRVETDVHSTVTAQHNETILLILISVLMLAFSGVVAYSNWRVRNPPRTEDATKG